jgi:hypothetical protein
MLCEQECLTVVEPVKGKHCLALVLPDVEKILARYVAKGLAHDSFKSYVFRNKMYIFFGSAKGFTYLLHFLIMKYEIYILAVVKKDCIVLNSPSKIQFLVL